MKKSEWNEGLCNIETDLVEKYVKQKDKIIKKKKQRRILLRIASLAACIAVIVSAIIVVPMFKEDDLSDDLPPQKEDLPPHKNELPEVPIWDNAQYSAEEIAGTFNSMKYDGIATNAYTKVYVPSSEYLHIDEMPDDEYFNLYQYADNKPKLDEEELKSFIDAFLPKLAESLDAFEPRYTIEEKSNGTNNYLLADANIGDCYMRVEQNSDTSRLVLGKLVGDRKIVIGGETIQIDPSLSDEEILASVQSIKNKLLKIFGVSFPDAKILRYFNDHTEDGVGSTYIYFYDESAHPLNSLLDIPISDYIHICFSRSFNGSGTTDIWYVKNRVDVNDAYTVVANAKRISLSDAEALLYNGYVFGGHSCRLCMEAQNKISFEGYDFVDIEYVFGYDNITGDPTIGMPFYAFYKKIGTAKNGNTIYAKTYVAAIEVSGYAEYFESQKANHKNYPRID